MKPAFQSKLYDKDGVHNGNCFAACLASLLEIPLWMVPPFEDMFGRATEHFMTRTDQWLEKMFGSKIVRTDGHQVDELPEFYIASGVSPRNVYHSVIYSKGVMVHDPHFSNSGIKEVAWTWHLRSGQPPVLKEADDQEDDSGPDQ